MLPQIDKRLARRARPPTFEQKHWMRCEGSLGPREYSFRYLRNKLSDEWADREAETFGVFGSLSEKYAEARARNDLDTVAVVCGEVVGLLKERPSAESIVKSMVAEAAALLRNASKLTKPT